MRPIRRLAPPALLLGLFALAAAVDPPRAAAAPASPVDSLTAVIRREPKNGLAHMRLGHALLGLGRLDEAAAAYRKANAIGFGRLVAAYNLAAIAARQGQADSAGAWLGRAFAAGYGDFAGLSADPDFAALRGRAGFDTLVAGARARAYPCEHDDRYRAFDFWIGEWNVVMNGAQVGTNSITRELAGCALYERWVANPRSGSWGHSVNRFDSASGRWRQLWVDSGGNQTDYEGVVLPDGLRFTGVVVGPGGPQNRSEMTFTRLPDGTVRQFIRSSPLEREEWTTAFDAIYVPKSPP